MKKLILSILLLYSTACLSGIAPSYWEGIKVTNNDVVEMSGVPVLVVMDSLQPGVTCNADMTDVLFTTADSTLLSFVHILGTDSFYVLPSDAIVAAGVDTIYSLFGYANWGGNRSDPCGGDDIL